MSRDFGDETGTLIFRVQLPLKETTDADGATVTVGLGIYTIAMTFYLAHLYGENYKTGRTSRSIQEDQLELFQQIEANIAATGMDGHACVLRFICEMQTHRFSHSSIIGELLSILFTPKPGDNHSLLKDYATAEMAGQDNVEGRSGDAKTCAQQYPTCPVSIFNALRRFSTTYSTPADRPINTTINLQGHSKDDDL